jgi:hypothetical protein
VLLEVDYQVKYLTGNQRYYYLKVRRQLDRQTYTQGGEREREREIEGGRHRSFPKKMIDD